MLFNADKQVKDNLFNMYQQDIMQRRQRKDDYLFQEKQSDRDFIEQIKRRNEEENQKKTFEKQRRINENMQQYNQFWQKKDEDRKNKFSKFQDVNINNYAVNNTNNNNFPNSNQNLNYNINSYGNDIGYNSAKTNPNIRVEFDSKKDHLNPIMNPDYIGIRKIDDLEKNKKIEDHRIYRNMLDAQMNLKPNSNEWNRMNRENTISLLALNKKNNNEEMFNKNPYSSKTYNIGTSQLSYNPITDPRNNIHYNKYLPLNQIKNISPLPTMPAIQNNNQINDYQNFNPNSNNNDPMLYNNNHLTADYPQTDYYGNADPSQFNANNINYGNEMGMGINMNMNQSPIVNNMNNSAYNKDNYTPQTRDRLRMAGNNIFN